MAHPSPLNERHNVRGLRRPSTPTTAPSAPNEHKEFSRHRVPLPSKPTDGRFRCPPPPTAAPSAFQMSAKGSHSTLLPSKPMDRDFIAHRYPSALQMSRSGPRSPPIPSKPTGGDFIAHHYSIYPPNEHEGSLPTPSL